MRTPVASSTGTKGGLLLRSRGDTGALQHPSQVDDLLFVDVVMPGRIERLGLGAQRDPEPSTGLFDHVPYALEERQHVMPLDVVAHRVVENLLHRRTMMPVKFLAFCHLT